MSEWHRVHRVVFDSDPARRELYVHGGDPQSRTVARVGERGVLSLATYFGSFPAGHWFAHTAIRTVRVVGSVRGAGVVRVWGTNRDGHPSDLGRLAVHGAFAYEIQLSDRLAWVWIDVQAEAGTIVEDVGWEVAGRHDTVSVTVAVTTFNRESDCLRLLRRISEDHGATEFIDAVVVVDQGDRPISAAEGYADVVKRLPVEVIVQPNLGGSGGFTRGMIRGLRGGSSHVLLLDDDVDLEIESVRRLVDFAAHTIASRVVGAQMLSLIEPTKLYSYGEQIDRRRMWWGPAVPEISGLDVAQNTVANCPALSRHVEVDFNGWWMCLVPTELIDTIGGAMPMFIKWDDAEFGLRAATVGVSTITLPGAALWHMPWTAKDDGLDWQSYFQFRNRVLTALLHGSARVLLSSLAQDVNHVLCAQYGSVQLRNLALADILTGPDHLDMTLHAGPARAMEVLRTSGQTIRSAADAPSVAERASSPGRPVGALRTSARFARVIGHQMRPARPAAPVQIPRIEGKWWSLGLLDRAVLESASGAGVFVVERSTSEARRSLRNAVWLRMRLLVAWRKIARKYREAAVDLTSEQAWEGRFARSSPAE